MVVIRLYLLHTFKRFCSTRQSQSNKDIRISQKKFQRGTETLHHACLKSVPRLFGTDLVCQSQAHQARQVHPTLAIQSSLTLLHRQYPPEGFLVWSEAAPPLVRDKIRCQRNRFDQHGHGTGCLAISEATVCHSDMLYTVAILAVSNC